MKSSNLRITLESAQGLPDGGTSVGVYAKVSITEEPETVKRTHTDMVGGPNPTWNYPVEFTVYESDRQKPGTMLQIQLFCEKTSSKDKMIGEVTVPIKSLLDKGPTGDGVYSVAGTKRGTLRITHSFGDRMIRASRSSWGQKWALKLGLWMLVGGAILMVITKPPSISSGWKRALWIGVLVVGGVVIFVILAILLTLLSMLLMTMTTMFNLMTAMATPMMPAPTTMILPLLNLLLMLMIMVATRSPMPEVRIENSNEDPLCC